jgi:hypothetical protein
MRPIPALDLKVEWTRNDRLKNLFADQLCQQQVKIHGFHLEGQAGSLLQVRSTDRALS